MGAEALFESAKRTADHLDALVSVHVASVGLAHVPNRSSVAGDSVVASATRRRLNSKPRTVSGYLCVPFSVTTNLLSSASRVLYEAPSPSFLAKIMEGLVSSSTTYWVLKRTLVILLIRSLGTEQSCTISRIDCSVLHPFGKLIDVFLFVA